MPPNPRPPAGTRTGTAPRVTLDTPPASEATGGHVRARGLTKIYGDGENATRALSGADLDVAPGELVAIMGASGSGKSTLLNCLAGLEPPTDGHVWIDGHDLWGLSERERTRFRARHMGFVFQSFNLLPVLTAQENIELPLLINGARPRAAREQAREMLERVALTDRADHTPSHLSGGEQQRVAIARALVHRPRLMWADEPTGNLDEETSRLVMDLLVRLNEETGTTIVLVTHDPGVARRGARILRMSSGRFASGTREGQAPATTVTAAANPRKKARSRKSAAPKTARKTARKDR